MNAIFFVDKAPESISPAARAYFRRRSPVSNQAKIPAVAVDRPRSRLHSFYLRLHRNAQRSNALPPQCPHLRELGAATPSASRRTIGSQITRRSILIFRSSTFLSRSRLAPRISLVPEGLSVFPLAVVVLHPGPKDHRLVLGADGAHSSSCPRQTRAARPVGASLRSLCRRSFSDQAPACIDGKAAASALREPLRTDRDQRLRLVRSRAALAGTDCADSDRQSLRQHRSHCDQRRRETSRGTRRRRTSLRARLHRHARLLRTPGNIRGLFYSESIRGRSRGETLLHRAIGSRSTRTAITCSSGARIT